MGVGHMAAGAWFTCGLLDDGGIKCWGDNNYGELGQGDMTNRGGSPGQMGDALLAVPLGSGRTAVQVAANPGEWGASGGGFHACALLDDGSIKCWGGNQYGQLGLGDTTDRGVSAGQMGDALPAVSLGSGRTAVAVAAGGYHTCALLDNGLVKCWGSNGSYQLGLGDSTDRGNSPGQMGDVLPTVSLGVGRTAVALALGTYHTCALLNDGSIKCWGYNAQYQLGLGDSTSRGMLSSQMGDALPAVSLGSGRTAVAVAAASRFTCALLDDGGIKCWGNNDFGELGQGDTTSRGQDPSQMGDQLPAVDLGSGATATSVSCGSYYVCALLVGGSIKCWGFNSFGELGMGDTLLRGASTSDMGDMLPAVALGTGRTALNVHAGASQSCALLDSGGLKCWGNNDHGQLGYGDGTQRGSSVGQMGDALPSVALGTGRTIPLLDLRGKSLLACTVDIGRGGVGWVGGGGGSGCIGVRSFS